MKTHSEERRQVPNAQIRDCADSFKAAWDLLKIQPPGFGYILPQINSGSIAIELYLKSLSAYVVHTPEPSINDEGRWALVTLNEDVDELAVVMESTSFDGLALVTAEPKLPVHGLRKLFNEIDSDIQKNLKLAYSKNFPTSQRSLPDTLNSFEGAQLESRYSFQGEYDIGKYNLRDFDNLVQFLHDFVSTMEVREWIRLIDQNDES